jgi:uncharacterized protein (TIGR02145 family)
VTVTDGNACPKSTTSAETFVNPGSTPSVTGINGGASKAYICGTFATLIANIAGGAEYQWFRDGEAVAKVTDGSTTYGPTSEGVYTVRYKKDDCWSQMSPGIRVERSNTLNLNWSVAPAATAVIGDIKTYSVVSAPAADSYTWKATPEEGVVDIMPLGNGSSASVHYKGPAENLRLTVSATGGCGTVSLDSPTAINVNTGCTTVTSVMLTPSTEQKLFHGVSQDFSVSAAGTGLSYKWYIGDENENNYIEQVGETAATYTFPATQAVGSYTLKAVVDNSCTTDPGVPFTVPVTVQLDPDEVGTYSPAGTFKLSGKNCLDVYQHDWPAGAACAPLSARKNDFAGDNYSFTYTFTANASYTDLTYVYADGSSIVSSVTGNGTTCTLIFKPEVKSKAFKKDKNEALKVTLHAMFKVSGTWYKESLEISIQDCVCDCPAKISSTQWLTFQCHNLGGEDIYAGTTVGREHHGDWYQFGAKNPSMLNTAAHDTNNTWDNTAYESGSADWSAGNNPCPSGYRLPTNDEWAAVINTSYNTQSTQGTWSSGSFDAVRKFGEYLILPAAGTRYGSNGALSNRGYYGYYWSSSSDSSNGYNLFFHSSGANAGNYSRDNGFSVRCVSE